MELNKEITGTNTISVGTSNISGIFPDNGMWSTGTVAYLNTYGNPERVSVEEVGDTIEMIFIEIPIVTLAVYPPRQPTRQVYKIVYSCKDGKWDKSEKIYGEIIPFKDEEYEFE
jgi:hypothetical protein